MGQGWVGVVDFWRLTPAQVWWLVDAKIPKQSRANAADMDEVVRMVKEAKAKEAAAREAAING